MDLWIKNLILRPSFALLVASLLFSSFVSAFPTLLSLANRCEYLMGENHVLEKAEFSKPPAQSQFQEIWKNFSPEQRSEIQRIIQTLQAGAHREANPQTRDSLQYYVRLLRWSLEKNSAEFRDPTHVGQIRDLYSRLKKAQQNFDKSGKSLGPKWAPFISQTLRNLHVLSRLKDGPTYENLAEVITDFTIAISKLYVGPIEISFFAFSEYIFETSEYSTELLRGHGQFLHQLLTIAPIAYVRHFKNINLQGFTDSFFFPELKLGVLDQPVTFDGRFKVNSDGLSFSEAYATPGYFYEHDLVNHGAKMVPRQFIVPNKDPRMGANLKITPENVLTFFRRLLQQYNFHLFLANKKSSLSPAHQNAVDALLMYIYHEVPEQLFEIAPEFTLSGVQTALRKMGTKDNDAVEYIVSRVNTANDIGEDLPHLRNTPKEKQRDTVNEAVQWLLGLKP